MEETLVRWRRLHQEARGICCHNAFLTRFGQGQFTDDEARQFGIQRYLKAQNFVGTMAIFWGKLASEYEEYWPMTTAVQRNMFDETGMWRYKEVIEDPWEHFITRSHEKHRQAFYKAWGIEQAELLAYRDDQSKWYPTTRQASEVISRDWTYYDATCLELAGWLAMAEHVLPGELLQILRGLEHRYPERFSDPARPETQATYSSDQLDAMRYARWYPEDHIRHDSGGHSQELEAALKPFMANPESYEQIERGARLVIEVNRTFYAGFC